MIGKPESCQIHDHQKALLYSTIVSFIVTLAHKILVWGDHFITKLSVQAI